jgi:hypothetical protein
LKKERTPLGVFMENCFEREREDKREREEEKRERRKESRTVNAD